MDICTQLDLKKIIKITERKTLKNFMQLKSRRMRECEMVSETIAEKYKSSGEREKMSFYEDQQQQQQRTERKILIHLASASASYASKWLNVNETGHLFYASMRMCKRGPCRDFLICLANAGFSFFPCFV